MGWWNGLREHTIGLVSRERDISSLTRHQTV
jgi:hypothetical protein